MPRALVKPLSLALLHTALPLAAGEQGNGVRVAGELPLHQQCTMCSILPASHIGSCGPAILRLLPRPLLCRRAERLRRASPCALPLLSSPLPCRWAEQPRRASPCAPLPSSRRRCGLLTAPLLPLLLPLLCRRVERLRRASPCALPLLSSPLPCRWAERPRRAQQNGKRFFDLRERCALARIWHLRALRLSAG